MNDDDDEGAKPPIRMLDRIMTVLYLDDSCGVTYGSIRNWFGYGCHYGSMGSSQVDSTDMVAVKENPAMLCIAQLFDVPSL